MIDWKDPQSEKPKDGLIVGMLTKHSKRYTHMNCEIYFGEVEYGNDDSWRACTCDETGRGSWSIYGQRDYYREGYGQAQHDDYCVAWFYAEELNLPNWILK